MTPIASLLPYLVLAVIAGVGALVAGVLGATNKQITELNELPKFNIADVGTRSILEGQIPDDDSVTVLRAGLVAFTLEKRSRPIGPGGKPSVTLQKWSTKETMAPPIKVVAGEHKVTVEGYKFPAHIQDWQHTLRDTEGTLWTTANTRLRGLVKGKPVIAIGTLQESGEAPKFKAEFIAAGTRDSYARKLAHTQSLTRNWALGALITACALFLGLAMLSFLRSL